MVSAAKVDTAVGHAGFTSFYIRHVDIDQLVNYFSTPVGRPSDARERLLRAAIESIWEQGYAGLRVEAVCKRAGVKKGSFYYFFPSKSRLAVEALKHHWETIAPEYDRVFSSGVPPLERLSRYFDWVYRRQRAHRARTGRVLGCPFLSVGCEVSTQDSQISRAVRELLRKKASYLESMLRDARAQGLVKGDPVVLARALLAYVDGVVTQARIQDDLRVLKTLEAGALRFLSFEQPSVA